jgi:riboflavin kinase / FMN adenylyltransferase
MKIIEASVSRALPSSVVTVGCFDGVHRGHRQLLTALRRIAVAKGLKTALLTFDPMPRTVIAPESAPPLICSLQTRLRLLEETGCVDYCCVLPFNKAVQQQSADEVIVENLVRRFGMRVLVVGENFACGRARTGTIPYLMEFGKRHNFLVNAQLLHAPRGMGHCSSTETRRLIQLGKLSEASRLLDRVHEMTGVVVSGTRQANVLEVTLDKNLCAPPEDQYLGAIRKSGPDYWRSAILTVCDPTPQGERMVRLTVADDIQATVGDALRMRFAQRAISGSPQRPPAAWLA